MSTCSGVEWSCECGYKKNRYYQNECHICSEKRDINTYMKSKSSRSTNPKSDEAFNDRRRNRTAIPSSPPDSKTWTCECGYQGNRNYQNECYICSEKCTSSGTIIINQWTCVNLECGYQYNREKANKCFKCGTSSGPVWSCVNDECGYEKNRAFQNECHKCRTSRNAEMMPQKLNSKPFWFCSECFYNNNRAYENECSKCGSRKSIFQDPANLLKDKLSSGLNSGKGNKPKPPARNTSSSSSSSSSSSTTKQILNSAGGIGKQLRTPQDNSKGGKKEPEEEVPFDPSRLIQGDDDQAYLESLTFSQREVS